MGIGEEEEHEGARIGAVCSKYKRSAKRKEEPEHPLIPLARSSTGNVPSLNRALPPVGEQRIWEQLPQRTTVWAWL